MSLDINMELSPLRQFVVALGLEKDKRAKNDLELNLGMHPRFVEYFRTSIKTLASAETQDELKQYQENIKIKLDFIQQAPNALFSLLRMAKEANKTYLSLSSEEEKAKQAEKFKKIMEKDFLSAINICKFVFAIKVLNYNRLFDLIMRIATNQNASNKKAEEELVHMLPFLEYQHDTYKILLTRAPKSISYLDTALEYAHTAIDDISSKEAKLAKLPSFDSENARVAKEGLKMAAISASILDVPHLWKLATWTPWAADLVHRQVKQVSFWERMQNYVAKNKATIAGGLLGGVALTAVLCFVFPLVAIITGVLTILSGVYAVSTAITAAQFARKELKQRSELTDRTVQRLMVQEKADNNLMLTAEKLGVDVTVSERHAPKKSTIKERAHATEVQQTAQGKIKSTLAMFKKLFSKAAIVKQLSSKKTAIEPEEIEMTSSFGKLESAAPTSQSSKVEMVERKHDMEDASNTHNPRFGG